MKITYNKLVRDRIPEIIKEAGKRPTTRVADEAEYRALLEAKLEEELAELRQPDASRPEELADILEVVLALAEVEGLSPGHLYALRHKKAEERGKFEDRVVLVEVEE
jgi:predicted house-cleaning noncanonical NTP pyrophosphatase (MazG superfamily)